MRFLIGFLLILLNLSAFAQNTQSQRNSQPRINLISNGGFETGKNGFATTGTFTVTTSSPMFDGAHATFTAGGSNQYLKTNLLSIPVGLRGTNCMARMYYKDGASGYIVNVTDGSTTIATKTITDVPTYAKPLTINFPCPTSGSLVLELRGSSLAAINTDNWYIGQPDNISEVAQSEFVGSVTYNAVNCLWSDSSGAWTNFAADADCNTPTGSQLQGNAIAPATKVPAIRFSSLPPGRYRLVAIGAFGKAPGAAATVYFRFNDGTTATSDNSLQHGATTDTSVTVIEGILNYTSAKGDTTIQIQGLTNNVSAPVRIDAQTGTLVIAVYRFPSTTELAYRPDQVAWKVDANIGGANPVLSTGAVSTYTEITDAGLDLVNNSGTGNITAQIPCSSTNSPTGTTCSSGSESIGVAFPLPAAGDVMACASFGWSTSLAASSSIQTIFQLVETPTNAQTILQEGKSRIRNYRVSTTGSTEEIGMPNRICGTFTFSSAGTKVIRLMYEQGVGGTVGPSIVGDRSSGAGQRDIHFEVYPLNFQVANPLIINSVVNSSTGVTRTEYARIDVPGGVPNAALNPGSWISSVTDNGVGDYTANFTTAFTGGTACTCSAINSGPNLMCVISSDGSVSSNTSVRIEVGNDAGINTDSGVMLHCMGGK